MTPCDGIPDALMRTIAARGFDRLTPVQEAVLEARPISADMLVSAQTGSGKTLAFGLSLARTLAGGGDAFERGAAPRGLVVAPTRELAVQVAAELTWLFGGTGLRVGCCIGGMDMRAERAAFLRGLDLVIGTPGRLRDHIEHGTFETGQVECVVLDEADEILDLGFRDALEFILGATPAGRQTLMFSATVTERIERLASGYLKAPLRIDTVPRSGTHSDIAHQAILVAPTDRDNAVVNLLRLHEARSAIVFCGQRLAVGHLTSRLENRGFKVVSLSGALEQKERNRALAAMRDGRARVCVATDLAARGIDLPGLDIVVHADLPQGAEALLHRSGRTGRAGRKGLSILVVPHTLRRRAELLVAQAALPVVWLPAPGPDDIARRDRERLLADPRIWTALKESERAAAAELAAAFDPLRLAAALQRMWGAMLPAPETLIGPSEGATSIKRNVVAGGVWFRINFGRRSRAEVRWVLPMLCRIGRVTRKDIGRIRILTTETLFEIGAAAAPAFAVAATAHVELGVTIARLETPPSRMP